MKHAYVPSMTIVPREMGDRTLAGTKATTTETKASSARTNDRIFLSAQEEGGTKEANGSTSGTEEVGDENQRGKRIRLDIQCIGAGKMQFRRCDSSELYLGANDCVIEVGTKKQTAPQIPGIE